MQGHLVVTADDFGRSAEINAGVLRAHREGILTAASLMVGGAAFEDAVQIARATPTLAVGLHVVVVDGRPVLPPEQLNRIVDSRGYLPDSPAWLGLRYFFDPRARAQISSEISAQFNRFAETGLRLTHVDGHQHMHLHPAIFPLVLSLAGRYKAAGIRLVRDDFRVALAYDRRDALSKLMRAAPLGILSKRCRKMMPGTGMVSPDRVFGLFQTGQMEEPYVIELLRTLGNGSAEIYFHPTAGPRTDRLGPNPGDLSTLISPDVRAVISAENIRLCSYADLLQGRQ